MSQLSRRSFVRALGSWSILLSMARIRPVFALQKSGFPLSLVDRKKLGLFADVIIPVNKRGPSATEANVIAYLESLLAHRLPRFRWLAKSTPWMDYYRKLVESLDTLARKKSSKADFSKLKSEDRLAVVKELAEEGNAQVGYRVVGLPAVKEITNKQLFELARLHIIQGYFADPQYGGNKDFRAWESIGHICHFNYPKDQAKCPPHIM